MNLHFYDDEDANVKCRAANVRLPKLPANKTADAIAERRQMLRAKQAQVHPPTHTYSHVTSFLYSVV